MLDFEETTKRIVVRLRWLRNWRRHWQKLGTKGEHAAARYLRKLGYRIIERQTKNLYGEIDIIAVDHRTVVFVEVKTRRAHDTGHPAEAVTTEKQQRLTRIALAFLRHHDLLEHQARFDVVAVTWPEKSKQPVIEHYQNAFEAIGRYQMFS